MKAIESKQLLKKWGLDREKFNPIINKIWDWLADPDREYEMSFEVQDYIFWAELKKRSGKPYVKFTFEEYNISTDLWIEFNMVCQLLEYDFYMSGFMSTALDEAQDNKDKQKEEVDALAEMEIWN